MGGRWRTFLVLLVAVAVPACAGAAGDVPAASPIAPVVSATRAPAVPPTVEPTAAAVAPVAATAEPASPAPRPRTVTEQDHTPFAEVGEITLHHPSRRVERVGFHQSNHEGAQQMDVLPTAVAPKTLETRDRLTGDRTAADVVADPDAEIRAPVTGTVKRAGTYVLYCEHSDDYAVIEPDGRPGWEVKILHIDGVRVGAGARVVAGETVLASRPTRLPFESQVDESTAKPAWPHVHVEVVDPSIPNRPSPGGGCN